MNELIAKLMKFLALESQNENIEVSGEVEKTEGKTEGNEKPVVDEKTTKESEVKAESVKAQTGVVHESETAELVALLKEFMTKEESKTEVKETPKNDNSELISAINAAIQSIAAKAESSSSGKGETKATKTPAQSKKSADGFNPAEPSHPVVTDLAGAIALARSGNQE